MREIAEAGGKGGELAALRAAAERGEARARAEAAAARTAAARGDDLNPIPNPSPSPNPNPALLSKPALLLPPWRAATILTLTPNP